jgi:hypothetical protein
MAIGNCAVRRVCRCHLAWYAIAKVQYSRPISARQALLRPLATVRRGMVTPRLLTAHERGPACVSTDEHDLCVGTSMQQQISQASLNTDPPGHLAARIGRFGKHRRQAPGPPRGAWPDTDPPMACWLSTAVVIIAESAMASPIAFFSHGSLRSNMIGLFTVSQGHQAPIPTARQNS